MYWFDHRSGHVGFVVDKVALGQVFLQNFGFSLPFFHHCSTLILMLLLPGRQTGKYLELSTKQYSFGNWEELD
jgi:hypothetical protein